MTRIGSTRIVAVWLQRYSFYVFAEDAVCLCSLAPLSCKAAKCFIYATLPQSGTVMTLRCGKASSRAAERPSVERSSNSICPSCIQLCPNHSMTIQQFSTSFSNCRELRFRTAALCWQAIGLRQLGNLVRECKRVNGKSAKRNSPRQEDVSDIFWMFQERCVEGNSKSRAPFRQYRLTIYRMQAPLFG